MDTTSSWLPAVPYPPLPAQGYWHPITSTLNWCEEDYYATHYVAEVINTFTNLLFMSLSVRGILNCLKYGHDRIFLVGFIGYGVVGTGSFLFHATLKYPMQLVDELSMIYTACFMFYASFTHDRKGVFNATLAISLTILAISITVYYHYLQNPVFHQNAYAILTAIVVVKNMWCMEMRLRPLAREEQAASSNALSDPLSLQSILRTMWIMVAFGLTVFLGGFAIWTLDNGLCSQLLSARHAVGMPWGFLLEGHGWWHVMTGVGGYFYIVWITWLRYCLHGKQREYTIRWPSMFLSLPDVVRVEEVDGIQAAPVNGAVKMRANGKTKSG